MRLTLRPNGRITASLTLAALSTFSWTVLFTSLSAGRTTPTTVSLRWVLTFVTVVSSLLLWNLVFCFLLKTVSSLGFATLIRRTAFITTALLLAAPLLITIYVSDQSFHYLAYNPIPRAMALWSPILIMLALQFSAILWMAKLHRRMMSLLLIPGSAPMLIFAAFACLYVFTSGGHLYSPDEQLMYGVTASLADKAVPAMASSNTLRDDSEPWLRTSKYGLVSSLLALPPYLASQLIGWEREPPSASFPIPDGSYPLVDLTVGPLSTATTCALLYLLARTMGFGAVPSVVATFAYGLSTSAWVYSKTFFSQPPATMLLLAAVYMLLRDTRRPVRDSTLAGILLGLAIGARAELIVLAAPLVIVPLFTFPRRTLPESFRAAVFLTLALVAVTTVTVGWYNYVKTGSLLMTGYGNQGTLDGLSSKPYIGIFGSLFSPGFGLFTFNPVALLGILSLPILAIKRQRESILIAGLLTIAVLFYGGFTDWFGGFTWANRYLTVILPLSVLPVAALLEHPWRTSISISAVLGATVLGILVNILAVLIDHNNGWLDLWNHRADVAQITWNPHFSPVGAHLRVLREFLFTGSKVDLYVYYKLGTPSLVAFLMLFVGLATLATRAAVLSELKSKANDNVPATVTASISAQVGPHIAGW